MTTFRTLVAASILSSLPLGAVFAQTDLTGARGGPLSAEKAPNTTVVGQTKLPTTPPLVCLKYGKPAYL